MVQITRLSLLHTTKAAGALAPCQKEVLLLRQKNNFAAQNIFQSQLFGISVC